MLTLLLLLSCSTPEAPPTPEPEVVADKVEKKPARPDAGKWRKAREVPQSEFDRLAASLEAIGYADGDAEQRTNSGVSIFDTQRAWRGRNVLNSGNRPEAELIDMSGKVLHRWCVPFSRSFPEVHETLVNKVSGPGVNHWRRVLARDDGSLFIVHEGRGIARLSASSEVMWSNDNHAHHDVIDMGPSRIAVLTREPKPRTDLHPSRPVLTDHIDILDVDTGRRVERISILDALMNSQWKTELTKKAKTWGDVLHTNTVRYIADPTETVLPIESKGPVWLISMRSLSAVAVIDASSKEMLWLFKHTFREQHDADLLDDGRLVMFDNKGPGRKHSRVLVYGGDPLKIQWSLTGTGKAPLRSGTLGTVRELDNGNLLVTESQYGRALEVDMESSEIVWQFTSSHRAGDDNQFVAVLFEARRVSPTFGDGWALGDVEPEHCPAAHIPDNLEELAEEEE